MQFPVQCLLHRPGGTVVDLYGTAYHFKPENDPAGLGRHVCEVANAKHLQRLMQIPEAYAILDDAEAPTPAPAPVITTPAPVLVAPSLGTAIAQSPQTGEWTDPAASAGAAPAPGVGGPVTLAAPADAEADTAPPAPAPQPDNQVAPVTLAQPAPSAQDGHDAAGAPPALPSEADLEAMDLEALRAQAEKETGRKPSLRAKEPLLISQIMAARAAKG